MTSRLVGFIASVLAIGLMASASGKEQVVQKGIRRLDGQRRTAAQVDRAVERLMTAAHVPGLAVAVINHGEVVHLKAYGQRDVEQRLPLTVDTTMYAASLTKAAFAYLVMQLVDEGVVDLDKSIADMLPKPLPEYEKYQELSAHPRWRQLTPRILLDHTTGFPNFRFMNEDGKLDIKFDPGTRYAYSGEGINLLQFVLENGLGLDVGALMQKRVFDRFGMSRTSMTWRADFADNVAIGYDEQGKPLGHRRRESVRAAGSMDTTVADYTRLLAGLLRGDGVSPRARAEMFREQIAIRSVQQFPTLSEKVTADNVSIGLSYGLGWGIFTSPFGKAVFKEGHDDGTRNYALMFERDRTALLLMSNSSNGDGTYKYLADELLGQTCLPWFWESYIPYDHPELRQPAALDAPHPPCAAVAAPAPARPASVR